ncbi:3-isopropylmalate dehydratase small subunit, partial [Acinetobacter gyllenbergii]
IGLTLQNADAIGAFEAQAKQSRPWVFQELQQ